MKKICALTGVIVTAALLAGCIRDVKYVLSDRYTSFPEAEILGAGFYYQLNGQDKSGDDAGSITKNDDGTYHVKMRRRSPSTSPSMISFAGPFQFSEYYKIVCTFPDDPSIADKPYRLYACASVESGSGLDGNTAADYPTASDLNGDAVFRGGVAVGTFEMTNEGINILNPADPAGRNRPYVSMFMYLYFSNVSEPDGWYEFTLDFVGGANARMPQSKVTRAEIYRAGDAENALKPALERYTFVNEGVPSDEEFILANYNHRLDSNKQFDAVPAVDSQTIHIDLEVPDEYLNTIIEFELRGLGLYKGGGSNLITRAMMNAAGAIVVQAGTTAPAQTTGIVEEVTVKGNPPTYYYVVKARAVRYSDLFGGQGTGVKLVFTARGGAINGGAINNDRFTCTITLPEKETEE